MKHTPDQQGTGTSAHCADCLRPYGDEHGFPDMLVPNDVWDRIAPDPGGNGLLCPSCICKRLHEAGIKDVPSAFMSGPVRSVGRVAMENLLKLQNLSSAVHNLADASRRY